LTARPPQLDATFFRARVFKLISLRSDLWRDKAKAGWIASSCSLRGTVFRLA
jgi:hypothetical protein